MLLSYFSNTISFVRVGAYAVSHAAMMEVVLMLGGREAGGSHQLAVIVLGNVFVACLEGHSLRSRYCVWNITRCSAGSMKETENRFQAVFEKRREIKEDSEPCEMEANMAGSCIGKSENGSGSQQRVNLMN